MTEDRRRSPRYEVDVPTRLTVAGESVEAQLHDICRDAVLVEAPRAWPLDTEVTLSLELPWTGGPFEVGGRVIRLSPGEEGSHAMAILFLDLTPAVATQIDLFLDQQRA